MVRFIAPDSFVVMLRYCANLKVIRYVSTTLNRIVSYKSRRVIVALVILTFCLHSLPLTCFQVKSCLICYEDTLLFMMNNLDKKRKKLNCFFFQYFKADFKDLF